MKRELWPSRGGAGVGSRNGGHKKSGQRIRRLCFHIEKENSDDRGFRGHQLWIKPPNYWRLRGGGRLRKQDFALTEESEENYRL